VHILRFYCDQPCYERDSIICDAFRWIAAFTVSVLTRESEKLIITEPNFVKPWRSLNAFVVVPKVGVLMLEYFVFWKECSTEDEADIYDKNRVIDF
jgi:hypothetical protein